MNNEKKTCLTIYGFIDKFLPEGIYINFLNAENVQSWKLLVFKIRWVDILPWLVQIIMK